MSAGAAATVSAAPGLAVRVRRVAGPPVVAVRVWLHGGARVEAVPGQAFITGRLLAEGTRRRDWRQIAEEIEARGMLLTTYGSFENHGIALDALAGDWETALAWAAELALEPTFPEDRCRWLARQTAGELESLGDQPEVRTAWGFLGQLYAPHRRALPLQGTAESLAALARGDCAGFHRPGGRRAIVAVAGEIDEAAVASRVGELLAAAGARPAADPEPPAPRGSGEARHQVTLPASDQAHLYVGHLTVPRRHPDHEALELLAVVLGAGSGLAGRIPTAVRERAGLAYAASAQTVAGAGLDPGRLVAYVGTAPETVPRAERLVRDELERLVADGVTEDELADSRSYLLGRDPFTRETARQWADLLAQAEHYGLPLDDPAWRRRRLEALDRPAVVAAARRHLRPDELVVTVGLPAAG